MKRTHPINVCLIIAIAALTVSLCAGCVRPGPRPPGPVDPPTPKPPTPAAISVLIVEETADRPRLPASQQAVFASTKIRAYIQSHGARTSDGKTPDLRVFDKDVDVSHEHRFWAEGLSKASGKPLPFVLVTTGKNGLSGSLPPDESALLAVLKIYGGE